MLAQLKISSNSYGSEDQDQGIRAPISPTSVRNPKWVPLTSNQKKEQQNAKKTIIYEAPTLFFVRLVGLRTRARDKIASRNGAESCGPGPRERSIFIIIIITIVNNHAIDDSCSSHPFVLFLHFSMYCSVIPSSLTCSPCPALPCFVRASQDLMMIRFDPCFELYLGALAVRALRCPCPHSPSPSLLLLDLIMTTPRRVPAGSPIRTGASMSTSHALTHPGLCITRLDFASK